MYDFKIENVGSQVFYREDISKIKGKAEGKHLWVSPWCLLLDNKFLDKV